MTQFFGKHLQGATRKWAQNSQHNTGITTTNNKRSDSHYHSRIIAKATTWQRSSNSRHMQAWKAQITLSRHRLARGATGRPRPHISLTQPVANRTNTRISSQQDREKAQTTSSGTKRLHFDQPSRINGQLCFYRFLIPLVIFFQGARPKIPLTSHTELDTQMNWNKKNEYFLRYKCSMP